MTTYSGGSGIPGSGTIQETKEYEILWGADLGKGVVLRKGVVYSGTMRDAGNTPTTDIRGGLLVGINSTLNEYEEWDADATDGTQDLAGVVPSGLWANDQFANDADRCHHVIVRAPLKASQLLIQGTALTSHADEFLARRSLHRMGCILDDDPQALKTGLVDRYLQVTGAALTPTTAQNGMVFILELDGTVAVTLPTCQPGLEYTFWRHNDTNLSDTEGAWSVTTASGADVLMGEAADAASGNLDTITYTTADEHQGSWVKVRGIYHGTTAKWLVEKNEGRTYAFSVT